ncbi:MAG TPA: hypothetical protein VJJ82_04385 [Candidatus Nanoarchaeia archaeon]|nr:hypothetical protein [Candidatus Nanoarchaeia archaeon]
MELSDWVVTGLKIGAVTAMFTLAGCGGSKYAVNKPKRYVIPFSIANAITTTAQIDNGPDPYRRTFGPCR